MRTLAPCGIADSEAQSGPSIFVYGMARPDVVDIPEAAAQVSPLAPGAARLEDVAEASASQLVVAAPAGTLERRYVLALAIRALKPFAPLTVLAPKNLGGARLRDELQAFGCDVEEIARRHHRICHAPRPQTPIGLDAAIAAGAPRSLEATGWTQPGLFSWDRLDPGTRLLSDTLPSLTGRGADLGCGVGVLSRVVLHSPAVERLALVDLDRRAIEMARRNLADARAEFHWADVRATLQLGPLDFIVSNPPFHDGGAQDMDLGRAFLRKSHEHLRPGGALWLVANRHLPYEVLLKSLFAEVTPRAENASFKVYEARR